MNKEVIEMFKERLNGVEIPYEIIVRIIEEMNLPTSVIDNFNDEDYQLLKSLIDKPGIKIGDIVSITGYSTARFVSPVVYPNHNANWGVVKEIGNDLGFYGKYVRVSTCPRNLGEHSFDIVFNERDLSEGNPLVRKYFPLVGPKLPTKSKVIRKFRFKENDC